MRALNVRSTSARYGVEPSGAAIAVGCTFVNVPEMSASSRTSPETIARDDVILSDPLHVLEVAALSAKLVVDDVPGWITELEGQNGRVAVSKDLEAMGWRPPPVCRSEP